MGGAVTGTTNLGRRVFAREMKKQTSGLYMIIDMEIDGLKVDELKNTLEIDKQCFPRSVRCERGMRSEA